MTLIAAGAVDGHFFMFGDVLLSAPVGTNQVISPLPSRRTIQTVDTNDARYNVVGFAQKLQIISDHLAFAWAGSIMEAYLLEGALRTEFGEYNDLSLSTVRDFVKCIVSERDWNISCICAVLEKKQSIATYAIGCKNYEMPFGEMWMAGSGADHFYKQCNDNAVLEISGTGEISSLSKILVACTSILGLELTSLESLKLFYGGAFEIVHVVRKEGIPTFQKFDDYTIVALKAEVVSNNKAEIVSDVLTIRPFYIDDDLIIHRARAMHDKANEPLTAEIDAYVISRACKQFPFKDIETSRVPSVERQLMLVIVFATLLDKSLRQYIFLETENALYGGNVGDDSYVEIDPILLNKVLDVILSKRT